MRSGDLLPALFVAAALAGGGVAASVDRAVEFARGMIQAIGGVEVECPADPPEHQRALPVFCATVEKDEKTFRREWDRAASTRRMVPPYAREASPGWTTTGGALTRSYEFGDETVTVERQRSGPSVVVRVSRSFVDCGEFYSSDFPSAAANPVAGATETPPEARSDTTTSDWVRPPEVVRKVKPRFPRAGYGAGQQAKVVVQAVIDTTGAVTRPCVSSSSNPGFGFEKEAVVAVEKWRFRPALLAGVPVPVYFTIVVTFTR